MISLIFQNHYERLQITRQATEDEIKSAFRHMARKHHPDVSTLGKDRGHRAFLLVKESYEVLRDPDKRKDYDQLISASERFKRKQQQASHSSHKESKKPERKVAQSRHATQKVRSTPSRDSPAYDTRRPSRTDLDNFASLEISLEEAVKGTTQTITLETDSNTFANHSFQTLEVSVPPLARNDQILIMKGRGLIDKRTGERGNLLLTIAYARHKHFRLLGSDLFTSVDIFPWDGALGSFMRIPTLGGFASLRIPPGSQPWQSFRLKGNGMPNDRGGRGDLIISLRFLQPPASTPEQSDLWKKLKSVYP